ncbi:MAG: hypothetical protein WKI04_17090 [Ferruginibacter sp.]
MELTEARQLIREEIMLSFQRPNNGSIARGWNFMNLPGEEAISKH